MYGRWSVASFAKGRGSTTADVGKYMRSFMLPSAPQSHVDLLLQYYPEDASVGCPFDTGSLNILGRLLLDSHIYLIRVDVPWLGPQYKRVAALQGDIVFHGPRRLLLKYQADKQNSWAFSMSNVAQLGLSVTELPAVHKRGKHIPFIGAVGFANHISFSRIV
jgi:acetylcholinesterase